MPIIKSAKKAARQTIKRTEHNKQLKKDIKLALKSFKADPTAETLARAQSEFDKAAKKGLMKKNTVSRRKASLHRLAKTAGVKLTVGSATGKTVAKKVASATKKTTSDAKMKSGTKVVAAKVKENQNTEATKAKSKTTAVKAPVKKPATKSKSSN